ncbi:serine acetyltransferase 1, chloroplastic-like [Papaver somniferum]|nr:serine acetyltransferase 1, chloroplastic-like [Papaver somniferum]
MRISSFSVFLSNSKKPFHQICSATKTISICYENHHRPNTSTNHCFRNGNKFRKFSSIPNNISDIATTCSSFNQDHHHQKPIITQKDDETWLKILEEARSDVENEPILSEYYSRSILSHTSLESSLANQIAMKLSNSNLQTSTLSEIFLGILNEDEEIKKSIRLDLMAVKERDPACISYVHCILNFKGFLAIQTHRIAQKLWSQDRKTLALLIQNRVSEIFGVDIHPAAKIGHGILLDHATGVVVGETSVIGNNVSILHNVTLGGTGNVCGDRHPKIGDGVLIGACTSILGNVKIGEGAKIGAGSVVLKDVPARTTAVGNPARLLGGKKNPSKLDKIPSFTMDHTYSFLSDSHDYVV